MTPHTACRREALVSAIDGDISRCGCGRYHVRIHDTTLHLTPKQFDDAARLFKLASGMLAGRRSHAGPAVMAWEGGKGPRCLARRAANGGSP